MDENNAADDACRISRRYWELEFGLDPLAGTEVVPEPPTALDEAAEEEWPELTPAPSCAHLLRCTLQSIRNELEIWTSPLWFY